MTDFELDSFLPYQISLLAGKMSRNLEKRYRAMYNLKMPEWRILVHLSQEANLGVNDLQTRVDLHKSRVSRAVKHLEEIGYVARTDNTSDKRRICLYLTSKGHNVIHNLVPMATKFQNELLVELGIDKKSFCNGTKKLIGKLH